MDISNRVKLLFKYSIALRSNEVNVPLTTWININYRLLNEKKRVRKKINILLKNIYVN